MTTHSKLLYYTTVTTDLCVGTGPAGGSISQKIPPSLYDIMPSLISVWKGRIYLPRNVPGEITVGRELELAGLFGPVIHNLNVP